MYQFPGLRSIPQQLFITFLAILTTLSFAQAQGYSTLESALNGTTTLISVASDGIQANDTSGSPAISADGRYVAFGSIATNLAPGNTSAYYNIFVHDRQTGVTTQVSVDSNGAPGNAKSLYPGISADGSIVVFQSDASNLVPNDTNDEEDIFVHNRRTGQTKRISVASDGSQGNHTWQPPGSYAISANGRIVAFSSTASNLVPNDDNGFTDVFVHELESGRTTRVSVASDGTEGNWGSSGQDISATGRYVAFVSGARNLVPDHDHGGDIYLHDRHTGRTTLITMTTDGTPANAGSSNPAISDDGFTIAFYSDASNLVSGDTNWSGDVFMHNRRTGITTLASVDSDGMQGNENAGGPAISKHGRYVTFNSYATNLVADDTNGKTDIFWHDTQLGQTIRVSVASDGTQAGWHSASSGNNISADGRSVTFSSSAFNLVPDDTTFAEDIYVHELHNVGAPARPTVVRASDGSFSDRVRVTWKGVAGVKVYRLFRCLTNGPTCGLPIAYSKVGTFDDKNAIPGKVYYYRVRACTATTCGLFSVANTGFSSTAPARPTGIKATDGKYQDRVVVTFNLVEGATVYRVFRCLSTGPTCGLPIGYPKTGIFNDRKGDPGIVYYYRVRACNADRCGLFSVANVGHR